jgi:hypothetical protein
MKLRLVTPIDGCQDQNVVAGDVVLLEDDRGHFATITIGFDVFQVEFHHSTNRPAVRLPDLRMRRLRTIEPEGQAVTKSTYDMTATAGG